MATYDQDEVDLDIVETDTDTLGPQHVLIVGAGSSPTLGASKTPASGATVVIPLTSITFEIT